MDKGCHVSGEIAKMGQIRPKMSQEGLAHFVVVDKRIALDLSALGIGSFKAALIGSILRSICKLIIA